MKEQKAAKAELATRRSSMKALGKENHDLAKKIADGAKIFVIFLRFFILNHRSPNLRNSFDAAQEANSALKIGFYI